MNCNITRRGYCYDLLNAAMIHYCKDGARIVHNSAMMCEEVVTSQGEVVAFVDDEEFAGRPG